jgi:cation-transporting ATPase 13A1
MDPFSFFQLFSVFLWMLDENRVFSLMILTMLFMSAFTIAIQRIKTLVSFRSMSLAPHLIHVYRDQKWTKISSYELKPMDIILIEAGYKYKKI